MSTTVTAVAMAAAFNLTCSGMAQFSDTDGNISRRAYTETYRVDPPHHLWCQGECQSPNPLKAISDAVIVFYDFRDGDDVARETVDRKSGAHSVSARKIGSKMRFSREGRCTVQPFSGFPE
jgi:hypothetical protein